MKEGYYFRFVLSNERSLRQLSTEETVDEPAVTEEVITGT
jgi:hypothetical protein